MDNKEEKNIPQTDEFEIIDIPMNNDVEINDNINIANDMSQIEKPSEISLPEENFQQSEVNNSYENNIFNQPSFNLNEENNQVEQNITTPLNDSNNFESEQISYNEISQPLGDAFNANQAEQNMTTPLNDGSNFESEQVSYNEISQPVNEHPSEYVPNEESQTNVENINNDSNNFESQTVYVPKKQVSSNDNTPKEKMDKSLKEMITMGIIVAVVIILLPFLYNLSTGKYHIMSSIKNTFGGLFETEEKQATEENKDEATDEVEEEVVEEEMTEDIAEDDDTQNSVSTNLNFDFTTYNNKIISNTEFRKMLDDYKNNIISLTPTTEGAKQILTIEIAKDVASAEYSISKPAEALESFSKQYLTSGSNYLINVTNVNTNVIAISATQQ